jgi:RNA polymerase sigma factor (sigma-70 family)
MAMELQKKKNTDREQLILQATRYIDKELSYTKVKYSLKRFMSKEDLEDMRSDCILEIIKYIQKFDPERGLQLQTYIMPRIRGFFVDFIRKDSRLKKLEEELIIERIEKEVTSILQLPISVVNNKLKNLHLPSSNIRELYIQLFDTGIFSNECLIENILKLSNKRAYIILSLYVLNKSVKEVSYELGFSPTSGWVYRIHKQCLEKLKEKLV